MRKGNVLIYIYQMHLFRMWLNEEENIYDDTIPYPVYTLTNVLRKV